MTNPNWITAKVRYGNKFGRFLGFPTVNLIPGANFKKHQPGVYSVLLKINNKIYQGALYWGPRIMVGEKTNRLEIFIFDFSNLIYGQQISYQPLEFIRPPMDFKNFSQYKKQLDQDIREIKRSFASKTT